jgi:hypothetical protein
LKIRQTAGNGKWNRTEHCNSTLECSENVAYVEVGHGWVGARNEQRHSQNAADALSKVKVAPGGELKRHFGTILNKLWVSA